MLDWLGLDEENLGAALQDPVTAVVFMYVAACVIVTCVVAIVNIL